jgi:hypothetical protein
VSVILLERDSHTSTTSSKYEKNKKTKSFHSGGLNIFIVCFFVDSGTSNFHLSSGTFQSCLNHSLAATISNSDDNNVLT